MSCNRFYFCTGMVCTSSPYASHSSNSISFTFDTLFTDLVPGWRVGWLVFQDSYHGAIQQVKEGAKRLAQVILGSSHLSQDVIPAVLTPSDESDAESTASWKENLYATIETQAALLCGLLNECHGLDVIFPEGGECIPVEAAWFADCIME